MIDRSKAAKIRAKIKSRECYKRLTSRQFATVKGYANYEDIALVMALNVEIAEIGLNLCNNRWVWLCACDMFARAIVDNYFPVYRVEQELGELLLEIDSPKQFVNELPRPIECGLFLLPKGLIGIDKWVVDWVLVDVVDHDDPSHLFKFQDGDVLFDRLYEGDKIKYRLVTQTRPLMPDTPGDIFISTFGYDRHGEELGKEYISHTPADRVLMDILGAFVKNLLLWLQKPRECEYVESKRGRGFDSNKQPAKPAPRYPIKLGVNEQPNRIYRPIDRPKNDPENKRQSPFPHRRKSHWRRVPVGKRDDGKRELKLIRQSFVGKPAE